MICFCAERFPWRRLWQNPGELLLPGLTDMATRALLYRRPHEPKTLLIAHGSQFFAIRLRRHRRARRYTLRIHPSDREAILTIPPRGTLAEAKDFAQRHGAWIAARLGRLPKAAPFQPGTVIPLRGTPHRIVHRAGTRGTVWTETRDSGERILCVAGGVEYADRRVHDFLKREARHVGAREGHIGHLLQAIVLKDNLKPRILRLGSNMPDHQRMIWNVRTTFRTPAALKHLWCP